MATEIRTARSEDADAIAGLLTQLGYAHDARALRPRLEAWLERPESNRVLVAELSGEVVGVIALHVCPYFERPGSFVRVTALVVDEGRRRRGVASGLVDAAETVARELGCARMEVMTRRTRLDAERFYAARGYADRCAESARFVRDL